MEGKIVITKEKKSDKYGLKEAIGKLYDIIEKGKGFEILVCPKCGSNAYCKETVTVGGLIVPKVDKKGYIHQSEGAHEVCIKWKCEKCGYKFR